MQRDNVEARCNAVVGYDVPPFDSMLDFKVWEEVEPPKGTVYNYPIRPFHNAKPHIAASPAPPDIAVQIYNRGTMPTMLAKLQSGQIDRPGDRLGVGRTGRIHPLSRVGTAPGARPGPPSDRERTGR